MDICLKIKGKRWNLSQDKNYQMIIKKENNVMVIKNLDHKLELNDAFDLLHQFANNKIKFDLDMKGNDEKLNMETKNIEEEKKLVVPAAHKCKFCNAVPKVVTVATSTNTGLDSGALRSLQCRCIASITGAESAMPRITYKRWIYTVDVINGDVDEADTRLINEWNRRMPL